jgi:branched-chain amino acid transport system ATP-binding protein
LAPHIRAQRGVVLVPEGRGLLPSLSVADNLRAAAFGAGVRRAKSRQLVERTDEALRYFPKLRDRQGQLAGTLSGGEQQMLVIARALVMRPKVLMLDEISLGLAPRVISQLYEIVVQLRAEGLTIVLVEQYAHIALAVADHALVMRKGEILLQGTGAELVDRVDDLQSVYLGGSETLVPAVDRRSSGSG